MTELLTAAQMRAVEQAAIASGEVTGLELMERAGRGVVEAIFEEWPELKATSHSAVVLCGPGNNGGDGFVVARLLKEWGWGVQVFLYGDPDRLPPDARVNYERWCGMGEVFPLENSSRLDTAPEFGLLVDALFGTGLSRPLPQDVVEFLRRVQTMAFDSWKKTSIDIASGMCADSGRVIFDEPVGRTAFDEEFAFKADLAVTFSWPKIGHFVAAGAEMPGRVKCIDIGLGSLGRRDPGRLALHKLHDVPTEGLRWWAGIWRYVARLGCIDPAELSKISESHKYTHGHALILSGPPSRTGAARLAARGALRIGAGLVTVGAVAGAIPEHAAQLTAIMLREVADGAALAGVLADERITALCLGPGLGLDAGARGLVAAALGVSSPRSLVLDADALTILARNPDLFAALHADCVLTPHAGEFARLFPDIAEKLAAPATKGPAYSKVDATREAAARAGCVVLFKGPDTVIADPDGRCAINSAHYDRAAPWLATAGSGDVLAGFITGLLARGFAPMAATETAAWLHVECARKFGPGLIAEDLPEQLPAVFRDLGLT